MAAPAPALHIEPGTEPAAVLGRASAVAPEAFASSGQSASWVSGEPASDVPLPSSPRTAAGPWGTGPVPAPSTRGRAPSVRPAVLSSSAVVPSRGPLLTSHPGGAPPPRTAHPQPTRGGPPPGDRRPGGLRAGREGEHTAGRRRAGGGGDRRRDPH